MSSNSEEILRVEVPIHNKEATGCSEERLGLEDNKMEALDIDKTTPENQSNATEDDRYSELARNDDQHNLTVGRLEDTYDDHSHDIDDNCKTDTQENCHVEKFGNSCSYESFDNACEVKQDYADSELQVVDTVISADFDSAQIHIVDAHHTNKEVSITMTRELEVKKEPSLECLKTESSSFDSDRIEAHESTVSTKKQDSEIFQIIEQEIDQIANKLGFLQSYQVQETLNTPVLINTDVTLQEIDKNQENNLKNVDRNDDHGQTSKLIEKSISAKKETDNLIDLNDDKFLEEISKSLINRDMTIFDTFSGIDPEESIQSKHKNETNDSKISENNQQAIIDDMVSVDIKNVPDVLVEKISAKTDVTESSTTSQLIITDEVKLLKVEEVKNNKNSDEVSLLTNLIKANTVEDSPLAEKNIELQVLIKDESNIVEIGAPKPKSAEEPDNVIHKLQNMNWLKPQVGSDSTMTRNRKFTLKSLPKKDERAEDYFEGTKKNTNNNNYKASVNNPAQSKTPSVTTLQSQSSEITPQAAADAQASVWNKNTVEQLFPEAQLVNVEDEQLSQAIAESICTAQQETEMRKMAGSLKIQVHDEKDDNEWGKKVYRNLPDEPFADLANYPKGLVDQFGRVNGYTEKHLFMGEGARRREQEFLKAQSETINSQSSKEETSLPSKIQQGPVTNTRPHESQLPLSQKDAPLQSKTQHEPTNRRSEETQSHLSHVSKKDASLSNRTQSGSANARSEKDTSKEKPGFYQASSKSRRRGSATKLETKSDNKNQQNSRNEKQEPREKPGFGQEVSKNSQQQQRGQTVNQDMKTTIYGQSIKQDVINEERAKQEVKTETRQNQQRQVSMRYEDQSRDKPGFNQGPNKDSYAVLKNQDSTAQSKIIVNKNLDSKNQQSNNFDKYNQCDNKNQDKDNRQQGNSNRHDYNKNLEPLKSNQDKDKDQYNKAHHQDYYNRNQNQDNSLKNLGRDYCSRNQIQDYSNNKQQTQDYSGKNQTQDNFNRNRDQDRLDRNQNQDRFDRNQNQGRFDRNQSQDQLHRTQQQEFDRNHNNFGRFQENSKQNQNTSDRNQVNKSDSHDYFNRSQTYDRYNELRYRDQNRYTRNQDYNHDKVNKNQDRFHKVHSEEDWNDYESSKSKLISQNDRLNETRNKDQDKYYRYQDSVNKYQDNANKNQDRFQTVHSDDYWNEYEGTNSKLAPQKVFDNKSQQQQQSVIACNQKGYYSQDLSNLKSCDQYQNSDSQENKKVDINKQMDISKPANINPDNPRNIPSSTQSNNSISSLINSLVEAKHPSHHSTPNTAISSLNSKEVKKDCKEEFPKAETVVTFSHVHESLASDSRPNVLLAFEGNQNVQRALGLDVNASNTAQSVNPQLINAVYANSVMNANALPFEASSLNAQQILNFQHLDSTTLSSLPLLFPAAINVSGAEGQLRMNEISNLSQDILRLHGTVVSLAKQLATAQADLLVAQAKFSQYQQPSIQTDSATSPTVQAEHPTLPANFFTMPCMTPPGFTPATPTVQKSVQADPFQLPKGYVTSNVQQDFVTDELHSNAALDQRLLQQYHLYQQLQPTANFQQYSANVNANVNANITTTSGVPRERMVLQSQPQPPSIKGRELRGCGNQFYN